MRLRLLLRRLPRPIRAGPASIPPTTLLRAPYSSSLRPAPSPPRLPPEQQAEFERLQRAAAVNGGAWTSEGQPATSTATPATSSSRHVSTPGAAAAAAGGETPMPLNDDADTDGPGAVGLSGGARGGAKPDFEGDRNPKTGEVGGPKNEPLRWGSGGDWSFNGRVTDF